MFNAEITPSGFWSKTSHESRGFFGGFFTPYFSGIMARKDPQNIHQKHPPKEPNTKIHKQFQGSGVLDLMWKSPDATHYSGISKPVVWGTRGLHPGFPWFSSFSWFP